MSTLHSRHPPFKAVEASRPPWEADRHVTVTQTSDPDWKPGQGVVPHALAVPPESDVHQLETAEMPPLQAYKLMINGITPRPIAFVSSVAADGTRNLAPYSFFNGVSVDPPVVAFSSIGNKDSYNNIAETKRFVVNIISEPMIDAANYTCTDCPADVDEFQLSGLTPVASSWADGQGPPRVGEAQYAMECELHSSVPFHSDQDPSKTTANLVLGRIVRFVIKKDVLNDDKTIDLEKLRPVGRAGGITYTRTLHAFETPRPVWADEKERAEVQAALRPRPGAPKTLGTQG